MVKISMSVEASSHEELVEALKNAGPNVHSFYGEIVQKQPNGFRSQPEPTEEDVYNGPPAEEPTPEEDAPAEPTPVYSKDEVRAELRKVMNLRGSEAMREILNRYGSPKLDGVPEEAYPAIIADVQKALEEDAG